MFKLCVKYFCGGFLLAKRKKQKLKNKINDVDKIIDEANSKLLEHKNNDFALAFYKGTIRENRKELELLNLNLDKTRKKVNQYSSVPKLMKTNLSLKRSA